MKFSQLKNSLSESLEAIYLIEGEDAFLRENAVRLIKQKALLEPDLNLVTLSGQDVKADPESFLTATECYPFMSEKRYVIVRDYYPTAQELKSKIIKRVFTQPCDTTVTIIVNSDKCEALKKLETITVVDCQKADISLISSWVRAKAKETGVVFTESAINKLAEFCNMDMARISGETEKLLCYVGDNASVTEEEVELLVDKDAEFEIYQLTDAIGKRNFDKAFEILSNLLGKNQDKQRLFISVYYHFRKLLHACVWRSSDGELAKLIGSPEFVVKRLKEQALKFKAKRLKQICDKLSYYDGAFKSGELTIDTALWNSILSTVIAE